MRALGLPNSQAPHIAIRPCWVSWAGDDRHMFLPTITTTASGVMRKHNFDICPENTFVFEHLAELENITRLRQSGLGKLCWECKGISVLPRLSRRFPWTVEIGLGLTSHLRPLRLIIRLFQEPDEKGRMETKPDHPLGPDTSN